MRLLDRYLLRELLLPLGYCLCGLLVFWISSDLVSELEHYQRLNLLPHTVALYYLFRMPEQLVIILPVSLLLALLLTLSQHARHHEFIAMRAAGISLWRLSLPYLAVGWIFSVGLLYLNEAWAPESAEAAQQILNDGKEDSSQPGGRQWVHNLVFKNDGDNRIWSIAAYNLKTSEMIKPAISWRLPDGTGRQIIAERGERASGGWTFYNVMEFDYLPAQDSLPTRRQMDVLVMPEFSETPDLIKSEVKVSGLLNARAWKKPQLSVAQINDYLRLHRRLPPEQSALLDTQLHGRLAEPWTCLIVVLIALPFGAVSAKRNVFVGVASSIFICFTYFVLLRLGLALGTGGYLEPWLAAWLPNLIFGLGGIGMTQRAQ